MKKINHTLVLCAGLICLLVFTQGCNQKKKGVWDDHKSALNFKDKENGNPWGSEDLADQKEGVFGVNDESFVALNDEDLKSQFADNAVPQPDRTPGELGSGIPDISHFQEPSALLASIFRNVNFNTDDHVLHAEESLILVDKMARYLKEHPHTYLFVEGHCDARGAEAYNLALGTRRANYIRSLLVEKEANPNQIYTISYGKERPLDAGSNAKAWAKNRRAQFKIYEKQ